MTEVSATRLLEFRRPWVLRFLLSAFLLACGVALGALFLVAPRTLVALFPLTDPAIAPSDVWDTYHTVGLLSLMAVVGLLVTGYLLLPIRGKGLILSAVLLPLSSVVAFNVCLDYVQWDLATKRGALDSTPAGYLLGMGLWSSCSPVCMEALGGSQGQHA